MKPKPNARPHGQLRCSQVVTTFGPGALVDLPTRAVLVGGLDNWFGVTEEVHEPRLVDKLKGVLGVAELRLFAPPVDADGPAGKKTGINAWEFPEWFVTQDVVQVHRDGTRSRALIHRKRLTDGRYVDDDRQKKTVVPIRFVRACPRGHIGDINWYLYVHGGNNPCRLPLFVDEKGTSGDLADTTVRCTCGVRKSLGPATKPKAHALGTCDGRRPWLGPFGDFHKEDCQEPSRLLIRSASNAYFPQVMSVISLPDVDDAVEAAVSQVWGYLEAVESAEDVRYERKKAAVKAALEGLSDEAVFKEIEARRHGRDEAPKSVKLAEFEVLSAVTKTDPADVLDEKFTARALPRDVWATAKVMDAVERVVLVDRLREVTAQVGFTRFEAASADTQGELDVNAQRAALARDLSWVPAVENKGEGFFLQFRRDAVEQWRNKAEVRSREAQLGSGFQTWKAEHPGTGREFPGADYVLMHTLAHLLMTAVSLECGYPASSLRERVYALPEAGYGILVYTGTPDAEGTLGGLIETGKQIARHLDNALRLGGLCSNDPVCAQHNPGGGHEQRPLQGAACHGCAMVAETSCEQHNDFLDRALVLPTVEGLGCEFFSLDLV